MTLATDLANRSLALGQQLISDLSRWYQDGSFFMYDTGNYHRMGMPHAGLMATLYAYTDSPALRANYLRMITEIVEYQIATNMNDAKTSFVDGGIDPFGYYGQYPDQEAMARAFIFSPTCTIEIVHDIAWILWQLPAGALTTGTRSRWLKVCQDCCTTLDTRPGNSITTYYINGNYQCQLMGAYWYTALASTGADKLYYEDCYERAYNFAVKPSLTSSTWTGWGVTLDVSGGYQDWSDYQVHMTETNTRVVGAAGWDYDPNYTTVQMDALARIYLQNRDSRLIRLINGMTNKNAALYTRSTWTLDGTGGSRQHNAQGYINCYFEIQALMGAKGASILDLTPTECLARFDGALRPNFLSHSTDGYFELMAGLSRTVAPIITAANMVSDATLAAS